MRARVKRKGRKSWCGPVAEVRFEGGERVAREGRSTLKGHLETQVLECPFSDSIGPFVRGLFVDSWSSICRESFDVSEFKMVETISSTLE